LARVPFPSGEALTRFLLFFLSFLSEWKVFLSGITCNTFWCFHGVANNFQIPGYYPEEGEGEAED
jgi:hypothetical protein